MNKLCQLLKIRYPIIQGGMGNISSSRLAAAISEAGGLGTIGVGTMDPVEVEKMILDVKAATSKPFALNIPLKVTAFLKEMIELAIKHQVPVVSLSAGNPAPYIDMLHESGIKVLTVVGAKRQAQKAEAAGADVIVAEGYEAAGINSIHETTTLTLIPQVVDSVTIPVVAAGGIGDGRGIAAMLALGASGVQMGTRFIAVKEAPYHEAYKQALLDADDTATIVVGRSVGKIRRLLKTPYTNLLLEKERSAAGQKEFDHLTSEAFHRIGALEGDFSRGFINSGQIAGLMECVPSVHELMEQMMNEASQVLSTTHDLFAKKS